MTYASQEHLHNSLYINHFKYTVKDLDMDDNLLVYNSLFKTKDLNVGFYDKQTKKLKLSY